MKRLVTFVIVGLFLAAGISLVFAQATEPIPAPTGSELLLPEPVTDVWDNAPIFGTVNIEGMVFHFLEAVPLDEDGEIPANAPWIPLSTGLTEPVVGDVLWTINTDFAPDGLCALRLTVLVADSQLFTDTVSPIRLSNARFDLEVQRIIERVAAGDLPRQFEEAAPPPAEPVDQSPRIVPMPQHNVVNLRRCDIVDNGRCPVIGTLRAGQEGSVLALSSNGTGWHQVRVPAENIGWVSPIVIDRLGDFSRMPRVAPPSPIAPPPSQPAGNIIKGMATPGNNATCDRPLNVHINVMNKGNGVSTPGTVILQDVHVASGTITATGSGNFPALNPDACFVVLIPLHGSSFFNELHALRAFTSSSQFTIQYTFAQGECGRAPSMPAPPQPLPTPKPLVQTFPPGACTVNTRENAPFFNVPNGRQIGRITDSGDATLNIVTATRITGEIWFEIQGELGNAGGYFRNSDAPFNQDVCRV